MYMYIFVYLERERHMLLYYSIYYYTKGLRWSTILMLEIYRVYLPIRVPRFEVVYNTNAENL